MSVIAALANGPRTSKEIQALIELSQASVSRTVRNDKNILRMPGTAPHRYAAPKAAFGDGYFEALPYYLEDARPQGFLGKIITENLAKQSNEFTPDPDSWFATACASGLGRTISQSQPI